MRKYHFVYITRRIGTPYYYYGVHSTDNLDDGYIGSGYHFLNAVNKYGKENFSREIIKFFDSHEEALKYENKIITKEVLNDRYCYNIQHGGKGSKEEHSLSTKEKISKANKGRKMSPESMNKRKKRSASLKLAYREGRHCSVHLFGSNNPWYEKQHTDEVKQKNISSTKEKIYRYI